MKSYNRLEKTPTKLFTIASRLLCQHWNSSVLTSLNYNAGNPYCEVFTTIDKCTQIREMLFVGENKKEIVICIYHGLSGIYARSLANQLLWNIEGAIDGQQEIRCVSFATDGRGHLFVCDEANECIQLFSTNGLYIGRLIKSGEHGLGTPRLVRWCKKTSSLITAHSKTITVAYGHAYMYISVIKLKF